MIGTVANARATVAHANIHSGLGNAKSAAVANSM